MNRFKGLDLVNSVPKKLYTEVYKTVQEAVNKTLPKKSKKAKWLSGEALQMQEQREVKTQGERGRHIQLNTAPKE